MDVVLATLPILPPPFSLAGKPPSWDSKSAIFVQKNHGIGVGFRRFLCRKTSELGLEIGNFFAFNPANFFVQETVNRPEIVPDSQPTWNCARRPQNPHWKSSRSLLLEGPEDHLPKIVQQRDLDQNWAGHRLETEFIWTSTRNRPDFLQNECFKVAKQEQRHLGWTMAWKKEAKERQGALEPWTSSWYGADWQTLNFWIPVPKKSPFLPRILPNLSAVALVNATAYVSTYWPYFFFILL